MGSIDKPTRFSGRLRNNSRIGGTIYMKHLDSLITATVIVAGLIALWVASTVLMLILVSVAEWTLWAGIVLAILILTRYISDHDKFLS